MKISIITCTYNSEKYLLETITSVRNQKHRNFEHIFIDAKSTDGTLAIIAAYQKEFPQQVKIYQQQPKGIALAMNFGVEKASGEVVCHLHSDDMFFDENVLETISKTFGEPEIQWCYGNLEVINPDGSIYSAENPPEFSYDGLLKKNYIPHPATFIRKSFFQSLGGFSNYKYAMDYDFWLRAGKISVPVKINRFLAKFRRHNDSLSTREYEKTLKEDYLVRSNYSEGALVHLANFVRYKKNVLLYKLSLIKNKIV